MARSDERAIPAAVRESLVAPADLVVTGEINDQTVSDFIDQLEKAKKKDKNEPIVLCCTTIGGDADMVRRIVLELERLRAVEGRTLYFLGKSVVYSAGVTLMSAFPVKDRFITDDTVLLIHGRQLTETVELDGPLRGARPKLQALLEQVDLGIELEEAGFLKLIEGSELKLEEVCRKAPHNWYVKASEAARMKLVAAVV